MQNQNVDSGRDTQLNLEIFSRSEFLAVELHVDEILILNYDCTLTICMQSWRRATWTIKGFNAMRFSQSQRFLRDTYLHDCIYTTALWSSFCATTSWQFPTAHWRFHRNSFPRLHFDDFRAIANAFLTRSNTLSRSEMKFRGAQTQNFQIYPRYRAILLPYSVPGVFPRSRERDAYASLATTQIETRETSGARVTIAKATLQRPNVLFHRNSPFILLNKQGEKQARARGDDYPELPEESAVSRSRSSPPPSFFSASRCLILSPDTRARTSNTRALPRAAA